MASSMTTDEMTTRNHSTRGSAGRGAGRWPASEHAARTRTAALALVVVYVIARLVPLGSQLDESMRGVHDGSGVAEQGARDLLHTLTPASVVTVALVLCVVAWRRSGLRAGLETALAIGLAPGLAEAMKTVLPAISHRMGGHLVIGSSFPSGHVAAVTALCLAWLAVSSSPSSSLSSSPASSSWRWVRRVPAVLLPVAVGVSTVLVGWHRPGDVVGGVLVALVAHHGVRALTRRQPWPGPRHRPPGRSASVRSDQVVIDRLSG